ncbi:MAG TPA: hypothetical protein VKV21_01140 [Solirubrobacteraceae bacterium]|nr:hypothetical protein [Solirubrobacteraceae bacterium]
MVLLFLVAAIVVLAVIGWAVLGLAIMLLWWGLIGLVIGGLGRLVVPGRQPIGILTTALLGIAAALLGGIVARAAHLAGGLRFLIAIGVAAALVAVFSSGQRMQTR